MLVTPQQIFADSRSRQTEGPPPESPGAGAGGPQFARQIRPMVPKHEAASLPAGSNFVLWVMTMVQGSRYAAARFDTSGTG
jgi:hypothetical protein